MHCHRPAKLLYTTNISMHTNRLTDFRFNDIKERDGNTLDFNKIAKTLCI